MMAAVELPASFSPRCRSSAAGQIGREESADLFGLAAAQRLKDQRLGAPGGLRCLEVSLLLGGHAQPTTLMPSL